MENHPGSQVTLAELINVFGTQMFYQEKLCIPAGYQEMVIMKHHNFMGHIGAQRLWNHMALQYAFAMLSEARTYTFLITRKCPTCEACVKQRSLKGQLGTTVIPPKNMVSVALDLFNMPQ